jgi:hypothetical protein
MLQVSNVAALPWSGRVRNARALWHFLLHWPFSTTDKQLKSHYRQIGHLSARLRADFTFMEFIKVPQTGDKNTLFGVFASACCGAETGIVLSVNRRFQIREYGGLRSRPRILSAGADDVETRSA